MKNIIKDGLIIWFGIVSLCVAVGILWSGGVIIYEVNALLLWVETILSALILGLGIYWLIKDIKGGL